MARPSNHLILALYLGKRVHPNGRTFDEIMTKMDSRPRGTAGVIQWLFPLTTPSRHVPGAPVLTPLELELFRKHPVLRGQFLKAVNKFLEVYGIALEGKAAMIRPNFFQMAHWKQATAHSLMPITRILRSLKLLEFPSEFSTLRHVMLDCSARAGDKVDRSTRDLWMRI